MKKLFVIMLTVAIVGVAFVGKHEYDVAQKENKVLQGAGIRFESIGYDEAVKKAKETGKIIFIDSYTEWCGPCKKMAATAFMDENVAKVFNSKFINVKMEMEKSADGPQVAKMYGVKVYPTLLFVNGEGKLVKAVQGYQTPEQLLAVGKAM